MKRQTMLLLFAAASLSGCTCHSTESTQVGVVTWKVSLPLAGPAGVSKDIYQPGATSFFLPFVTDWATYDISLQNLAMVKAAGGDRAGEDDVSFKTIDGNDIRVDVTVAWQIIPDKAPHLLQRVGESTTDVKEKLVRPASRSVIRDVLNQLHSEDFYVSEKRFQAAAQARDALNKMLEPEGVSVSQVILGEHRFHPEYEQVIREKKLAEQNTERLRSEARAAAEQMKSKLEQAKGQVNQQLAQAAGNLDQVKLAADASFFQSQKQAEAILAERKAQAQAIRKRNEALAGSGGRTMVKLKLAEALAGKQIVFLPSGGGSNLQTINLNALLKTYGNSEPTPETPEVSSSSGGE